MKHLTFEIICQLGNKELSGTELYKAEQHLAGCPECHQQFELWQSFCEIGSETIAEDPTFVRSVMRNLPIVKEKFSIQEFFFSWSWQLGAAALSVVVLTIAIDSQTPDLNDQFAQVFTQESEVSLFGSCNSFTCLE